MKRMIVVLSMILSLGFVAEAQYRNNNGQPVWANSYFEDARHSYVEVVSAVGYDEGDARKKALQMVVQRRNMSSGGRYGVSMQEERIIVSGNDELTVKARVLDEFVEHLSPGQYRVSMLVQTAKHPDYPFDPVTVSDKYPASARALFPGMAQIYKGSVAKGALFITSECLFIGGIVAGQMFATDNFKKSQTQKFDAAMKKAYVDKANTCLMIRNISIAGSSAVYIWSLVDGLVAKGKLRVAVGDAALAMNPYTDSHSSGLAFNMTF